MSVPIVRPSMRAALVVSVGLLLFGSSAALATKVGDRAAEITLPDLDGNKVKLSDLKGSVVVLDFWASWCGPCKKELPALDAMAKGYAGKPVVFIAVNIDKEKANATRFLTSAKISSLRILLDPEGKSASAYDLPSMPSSFVIDAKGLVRHAHAGFNSGDEKKIASEVDLLLKAVVKND